MRLLPSILLPSLLLAAACGGPSNAPDAGDPDASEPDAAVAPAFRNEVDLDDDDLALQALQLLGAEVPGADTNCGVCHGLTRQRFNGWQSLSETSMSSCLTNLEPTTASEAIAMIACFREDPENANSPFDPAKLGMYSTAVHLDWFTYLFELGYGDGGAALQNQLIERAQMPRGGHAPFDQAQFDVIAEWVDRGMPLLNSYIGEPPIEGCEPEITPAVAAHVAAMQTQGWTATNAAAGLQMHGCQGASNPRECLATYTNAATTGYGGTWDDDLPGTVIRTLYTMNYGSSYWTRSSADGRFVAHGGGSSAGGSSTIIDLANPGRLIGTSSFYDPGFFPDNSGFAFQGGGAEVCDQSVLTRLPLDNYIDYSESGCNTQNGVGLYQHMGASVGGDYWIVNSQWAGDNGGWGPSEDPGAWFDGGADVRLIPLIHDGTTYQQRASITKPSPNEGDTVLSPAAKLLVSRIASVNGQAGYRLRALNATPNGDSYTVETPVIATYCLKGAKPAISFDERWLITHHYITDDDAVEMGFTGPSDPGFQAYRNQGSAQLYLVDLLTGEKTRITRMAPGQFALFPHFRSDGWIYFNVRTSTGVEYIAASDAALLLAAD